MCVETRVTVSGKSAGNFRSYALHKRGGGGGGMGVAGGMRARDGRESLLGVRGGNYGL